MADKPRTLTEQKKRQRILIGVLAAALLGTGGVIWFGFFGGLPGGEPGEVQIREQAQTQQINLNLSAFESDQFQELRDPPPPIQIPEEVGRNNPFVSPGADSSPPEEEETEEGSS